VRSGQKVLNPPGNKGLVKILMSAPESLENLELPERKDMGIRKVVL